MFFALKGERFDGNQFALEALKNGAAYAIVDDPTISKRVVSGGNLLLRQREGLFKADVQQLFS